MDLREYATDELLALLPVPADKANKYTRGKLTVVAGCERYPGAACLAAFASQRMGAGYTEVVTSPSSVSIVQAFRPSLVVRPWDTWDVRVSAPTRSNNPFACLVGSGFDVVDDGLAKLVYRVLKQVEAPVVVDAGGLAALTSTKGQRLLRRRFLQGWPTVVTPHGGEAARLAAPFNLSTDDPAELAQNISLAYGVVAVVKGADTLSPTVNRSYTWERARRRLLRRVRVMCWRAW